MLDPISLKLLKNTRLTDKQSRVYLALLQLGRATVSQIAAFAELKRSITYIVLEELVQDGYAQLVETKRKTYSAVDPNALMSSLERTAHDFREMLPYLRGVQRKAGKPYLTSVESRMDQPLPLMQIRHPKQARYMANIQELKRVLPQEVERWERLYATEKSGRNGRHLLADTPEDRHFGAVLTAHNQEVRYLGKNDFINLDFALTDGTIQLITLDQEAHITRIESPALYGALCLLFDRTWQTALEK